MSNLKIVYMGTPHFAVAPLDELIRNNYNVVAVITTPDKKAGRGHKVQSGPVKDFALKHNIPVLQPEKLRDEEFLNELNSFNADLQIVVAFRMLPKVVWNMPKLGTFNLHASLLPQYRGAAPINWAIINGEKKTGVTTFFLDEKIDTGKIIFQAETGIAEEDNAGTLHDKMMKIGAELVVKTVDAIDKNLLKTVSQDDVIQKTSLELKDAPKIFKEDCHLNWNHSSKSIFDRIRGFSPYPGAWTNLQNTETESVLKIFSAAYSIESHNYSPGNIIRSSKKEIKIACSDGFVLPQFVQLSGKKKMDISQLLQGFDITDSFTCS